MKKVPYLLLLVPVLAAFPLVAQNTSPYQFFANGASSSASAAEDFASSANASYDEARNQWGQALSPTSGPCYDAVQDARLAATIARAYADYARDQANLAKDNAAKADAARKRLDELALLEQRGGLTDKQKQEKKELEHVLKFNTTMLLIHANRAADGAEAARDAAARAMDAMNAAAENC